MKSCGSGAVLNSILPYCPEQAPVVPLLVFRYGINGFLAGSVNTLCIFPPTQLSWMKKKDMCWYIPWVNRWKGQLWLTNWHYSCRLIEAASFQELVWLDDGSMDDRSMHGWRKHAWMTKACMDDESMDDGSMDWCGLVWIKYSPGFVSREHAGRELNKS